MLKGIDIISTLGSCYGSYGIVLLAKQDSKLLAIKRLDLDKVNAKELEAIQNEIFLTRSLQHSSLLPIKKTFISDHWLHVVTSAAGFGSCADLVNNHFPCGLSESAVAVIARDVVQALNYLHCRGLIHRAVRARHIFITSNGSAMLTCLRHAQPLSPGSMCHTFSETDAENLNWLSPEVLAQDKEGYNEKSDIYSVAMTVLEMVNGEVPYSDLARTFMLVQKLSGWVPAFNRDVSAGLLQLRDACTREELQFRPTAQQLLHLPFLKVKGTLCNLLHPVIPMELHQVQGNNSDDFLSHSDRDSTRDALPLDWSFE